MAKAQLAATVYVTDPDSHQTVELAPGTCPEDRLAALVTNPVAWVDGKRPDLPKTTGDGPDGASGAASDTSGDGDTASPDGDAGKTATAAKKTAARKTAASKPARGRDAADKGDGGE